MNRNRAVFLQGGGQLNVAVLRVMHVDVIGRVKGGEGVFLPGQRLRVSQREHEGQHRLMALARQAVLRRAVQKRHLLPVVPELGEVVLPEDVGHHFRRQLFPDLIPGLCVARIV